MTTTQTTATLCDYETAEPIRPATVAEHIASVVTAGLLPGPGEVKVDGRSCYVAGDIPEGVSGVRWDGNHTECMAIITEDANAWAYAEAEVVGEWVNDTSLTGEADCSCNTHAALAAYNR